jgi:hypothetical protein
MLSFYTYTFLASAEEVLIYIVKCSNMYFLNDLPKLWCKENQIFFTLYVFHSHIPDFTLILGSLLKNVKSRFQ